MRGRALLSPWDLFSKLKYTKKPHWTELLNTRQHVHLAFVNVEEANVGVEEGGGGEEG